LASDGVKIFTRSCLPFPFRLSKGKAEGAQWQGVLARRSGKRTANNQRQQAIDQDNGAKNF